MTSKAEILSVSKLKLKKYRESEQRFIAEGKRLVSEGLNSSYNCTGIIITQDFMKREIEFYRFLESRNPKLSVITNKDFLKITSTKNPQGIAAIFEIPKKNEIKFEETRIICLENISDPGNVGTILRSCDWFGIKTVILSKECADLYNSKVLRASMGAIFNLNILSNVDLITLINKLKVKNYYTYFADMKGLNYREAKYSGKVAITFCSEAFGPSKELREVCHNSITIPKHGNIDSLNVAAAAAVILSHFN